MQGFGYYFGTVRPVSRRTYRKDPARSIDAQHTQVLTIQALIAEVDHSIKALDRSIEIEQERAGVTESSHYAYPMTARAMGTRRDNLKITKDALANRLSSLLDSSLA